MSRDEAERLAYQIFFFTQVDQVSQSQDRLCCAAFLASHTPSSQVEYRSGSVVWQTKFGQPLVYTLEEDLHVTDFGHQMLTNTIDAFAESHLPQSVPQSLAMDQAMRTELEQIADLKAPEFGRLWSRARLLAHRLYHSGDRSLIPFSEGELRGPG